MKSFRFWLAVFSAGGLLVGPVRAQSDADTLAVLKRQVEQLTNQVHQLQEKAGLSEAAKPATAGGGDSQRVGELEKRVDELTEASKKTFPGINNPAFGLVGETVFSYSSKDSDKTGSDRPGGYDVFLRSVELNISASVDPFARAYAVVNASADSATGEASWGIEEAPLITTALPWNLTLEGGRFFAEFGRLAFVHDHEMPSVNRPLVLDNYIGGESQTDGLQLNWLVPTEHYISFTAGIGDHFGDPKANPGVYRGVNGFTDWAHLSTYFNVSDAVSIETGISGLITPKEEDRGGVLVAADGSTQTENERRVAGLDFTLRYEPLQNFQFSGFTWGTEILESSSKYLFDPDGSLDPSLASPAASGDEYKKFEDSWGLYSYLTTKLSREWAVGFQYDQMEAPENNNNTTRAYSPYVTWNTSHFQMVRLQYTHTDRQELASDDAVYLQWQWIMGAHSHGFSNR